MNNLKFTKEEILFNAYEKSKDMCNFYIEKLAILKSDFLYEEYLDLLGEQLDITRELRELLMRKKYFVYHYIEADLIEKTLTKMINKLESISK